MVRIEDLLGSDEPIVLDESTRYEGPRLATLDWLRQNEPWYIAHIEQLLNSTHLGDDEFEDALDGTDDFGRLRIGTLLHHALYFTHTEVGEDLAVWALELCKDSRPGFRTRRQIAAGLARGRYEDPRVDEGCSLSSVPLAQWKRWNA